MRKISNIKRVVIFLPVFLFLLTGCKSEVIPDLLKVTNSPLPVLTKAISATQTKTKTPTFIPSHTPTVTPQSTATYNQPVGCLEPNNDYSLVEINGMVINQRTFDMLKHAQLLYGGELELTGYHLTQGSYNNEVSASFGTHSGGGAVDISVIQYGTYKVLYQDIDSLIVALRTAGFAAWLRDFDQLYAGSPIHIHAIAIGDRDLSIAAQDQLTGEFGYFRGYNGLPQSPGIAPQPDEHGSPILCQWMTTLGYKDLRPTNP